MQKTETEKYTCKIYFFGRYFMKLQNNNIYFESKTTYENLLKQKNLIFKFKRFYI